MLRFHSYTLGCDREPLANYIKLYFATSLDSITSRARLRPSAKIWPRASEPAGSGPKAFLTNSIAAIIAYEFCFAILSYSDRVKSKDPMSCPSFFAFRMEFARYATSAKPKLRP